MTKRVVAAIDEGVAAEPVLVTAIELAALLKADLSVVHVQETTEASSLVELASRFLVRLQILTGDPVAALVDVIDDEDILMGVLASRNQPVDHAQPSDHAPVGHAALAISERVHKPIVVVPPTFHPRTPPAFKKVLVPLDGTSESTEVALAALRTFSGSSIDVRAVHVFDPKTMLRFMDNAVHGVSAWAAEFLTRHLDGWCDQMELRRGQVGAEIVDCSCSQEADLIVMGWSQNVSPGHAMTIKNVLAHASIPVLLMPVRSPVASTASPGLPSASPS